MIVKRFRRSNLLKFIALFLLTAIALTIFSPKPEPANTSTYSLNAQLPFNQPENYPINQTIDLELYRPTGKGKLIKIRNFPNDKKVKLFRVAVSTNRTEFVVTNDLTQDYTPDVQAVCAIRWKIEEFHRELKHLTGIEACQCLATLTAQPSCLCNVSLA
jgi:hypothetical protein